MAERAQTWLLGLLAAQIALAVALLFGGGDGGAAEARRPLVAFAPDRVTAIEIASPDGAAMLARAEAGEDGDWVAPALDGFAVDGARVERLLAELAEAARGWPVADRAAVAERFAVDETVFQKRLTLTLGARQIGPIYLGVSPAIGVVHARLGGEDAIYAIDFDAIDAAADDDSWVLRDALDIDDADVARIVITRGAETIAFVKEDGGAGFTLEGAAEGETVDADAVRGAITAILRPRYQGVEPADAAESRLADPVVDVAVVYADGTGPSSRFALEGAAAAADADQEIDTETDQGADPETDPAASAAPSGALYFSRSDYPQVFRGRAEDFAALLDAERAGFLVPPPEPEPEPAPPADPPPVLSAEPDAPAAPAEPDAPTDPDPQAGP